MKNGNEKLLCFLEERLVQHDNSRKEVQNQLQDIYTESIKEADLLEEKINEELQQSFNHIEERVLSLIERFSNQEGDDLKSLIKQARKELSNILKYEIQQNEKANNLVNSYKPKIIETKNNFNIVDEYDIENIINRLQEHLNKIHESMSVTQDELTEICTKIRNSAEEVKKRTNEKLEPLFIQEDAQLRRL